MRIIIEDEEAVERVRRRGGDKSATETVARLIREADTKDRRCTVKTPIGVCDQPVAMGTDRCFGHHAVDLAPKRKGAK